MLSVEGFHVRETDLSVMDVILRFVGAEGGVLSLALAAKTVVPIRAVNSKINTRDTEIETFFCKDFLGITKSTPEKIMM